MSRIKMKAQKKKGPFYIGVLSKEPLEVLPKNVVPLFPQKLVRSAPYRVYECKNYGTCLGLAADLNWKSFSCAGCCGKPNEELISISIAPKRKKAHLV